MKEVRLILEDEEYEKLIKLKDGKSWKEFLIEDKLKEKKR